jgi:hypothetical protein
LIIAFAGEKFDSQSDRFIGRFAQAKLKLSAIMEQLHDFEFGLNVVDDIRFDGGQHIERRAKRNICCCLALAGTELGQHCATDFLAAVWQANAI